MISSEFKKLNYHILRFILMTCVLSFFLISCSNNKTSEEVLPSTKSAFLSKTAFLLNTLVTIQLYDKQEMSLIDGSFDLIRNYEGIYSRTLETSELYLLNHGLVPSLPNKPLTYKISEEMARILTAALFYSEQSKGAFDLTVAPITSLWDFQASPPALPDKDKLEKALTLINYKNLQLSGTELTYLKEGIGIDLGAIAKGYIADRVKEYLLSHGVKSALINLGGNLLCIGSKPGNKPFHIGIQKPYADRNETIATMEITDQSVVSSGVYERFFELEGRTYHHILDPATGYPYDNGLISVTIISDQSVDGDGLSTSCFALGLEEGLRFIEKIPNTYAVFITEDYKLHYSSGFESAIPILP